MTIIDLLSRISPTIADTLQTSVDVAHCLGPKPKKGNDPTQPRRIIVQFLARMTRDCIWKDAKNSEVLKQKKRKITEDLTQYVSKTQEPSYGHWWKMPDNKGRSPGAEGHLPS
ncbi:hypothetical protein QQF64_017406 [Cirrhinus molitorella]|uniref:Uncharacterized protein n=1 Tax=Cirrhinus molitorella TaxID=172907 RepID=A0ABR3LIN2_9TELE